MGSVNAKYNRGNHQSFSPKSERRYFGFSEFSLVSAAANLSARSLWSENSIRSSYSASRPWSRLSKKRSREDIQEHLLSLTKTSWPIPCVNASFLPEFKINGEVNESHFEVVNLISCGKFGKVYKVLKTDSNEYYAMKVLKKSQVLNDDCIKQVKDEVRIQSACGHNPFVVNCPYYWQSRRHLYIVSDLCEGGDLFQFVTTYGHLPEDLCRIYTAEIALAIDFLHNVGVIYRDLKAENVLLDDKGHAMLADFGLAKWLRYGERTNTICGTLQYMAPELFMCAAYTHSTDWWSLGVLLCFLLTEEYPTGGNSRECPGALPPTGSQLSVPVRDLLGRLLQTDPTKRLRSLLTLQNLAFFHGFDFSKVRTKEINPLELVKKAFPDGPRTLEMVDDNLVFFDLDSLSPVIV